MWPSLGHQIKPSLSISLYPSPSHFNMAMVVLLALLGVFLTLFIRIAYETLTCYWLTPRRITKIMERQGVVGPKPRFLVGNILDTASLVAKSTSKDMDSINHDIVGRLLPHFLAWSKNYGNLIFILLCLVYLYLTHL